MKNDKGILGKLLSVEPALVCQSIDDGLAVVRAFASVARGSGEIQPVPIAIAFVSLLLAASAMQRLAEAGYVKAEERNWAAGVDEKLRALAEDFQSHLRERD